MRIAVFAGPFILICPMVLLIMGLGSKNIEVVQAAADCSPSAVTASPSDRGGGGADDLGVMPTNITASSGGPVQGRVLVANANIKHDHGFAPGVRALTAPRPDFITLNEVGTVSLARMRRAAPGYDAFRVRAVDRSPGGVRESPNNAIMWRSDRWTRVAGGRVKIVDDDHRLAGTSRQLVDRYAVWAIFTRADGAVVPVVAVHHMVNAYRYPRQWGNPPMSRVEQYALGMDHLRNLVNVLSAYGPVLVGGDMNSHPNDGPDSAAKKMAAAGYKHNKGRGVIYQFFADPIEVHNTWQISEAQVHSDHPGLFTRLKMNGAGPASQGTQPPGTTSANCTCPTESTTPSVVLAGDGATGADTRALVAAQAAYEAGFRGTDLVLAVALAGVESTWRPRSRNGRHFGLWQISNQHRGKVDGWTTHGDIYDPSLNARYAYALYSARSGSGTAKFADWIPFQEADYRDHLSTAQRAVATVAGTVPTTSTTCSTTPVVTGNLSARLQTRIAAMLSTSTGLCSLPWTLGAPCTYYNQCPKVVDALYGGGGRGRGYGNGQDVAQGIINAGLAQAHGRGLDPMPPPGAVVSYRTGNGVGHVAVYVGNGMIFGNDYGCQKVGGYGCVGYTDIATPAGSVTWALPKPEFDLGGMPTRERV